MTHASATLLSAHGRQYVPADPHCREAVRFISQPGPNHVHVYSNDYLAIGTHPKVLYVQIQALRARRSSAWMSGVFIGEDTLLSATEQALAAFLTAEAVLLSQSGYCANISLLERLAADSPIYID